jgi:hypothetical protein
MRITFANLISKLTITEKVSKKFAWYIKSYVSENCNIQFKR